jgi:L-ornithine N5-oxygenase
MSREVDYDVIGAGFGPANAALAVLLADAAAERGSALSAQFFEQRSSAVWHPGMLVPGATSQDTFLEDLVTPRNPRSRFTFLNYLHQKGRLYAFMRRQSLRISRREFSSYLDWAAGELGNVRFSHTVVGVRPLQGSGDRIDALAVQVHDAATGCHEEVSTRNLVIAVGARPHVPDGVPASAPGIFHSSRFVPDFRRSFGDVSARIRVLVVGSGQSAAEIVHHLLVAYPDAQITWAYRRILPSALDDSPLTWEPYQGEATADLLDRLPPAARAEYLRELHQTNYSCINVELLEALHELCYQEEIADRRRLHRLPHVELREIARRGHELEARFQDRFTARASTARFDAAVLATGYRREVPSVLEGLNRYVVRDADGGIQVSRAYEVLVHPTLRARVFVQGISEHRFGIRDGLSADVAVRVQPIFERLLTPHDETRIPCPRPTAPRAGIS